MFYTNSVSHQTRNVNKNIKLGGDIFMDEKNSYTREDVLEVLVEENRKFRQEIMLILYRLIFGMVFTVLIVATSFVCVVHTYFYSPSDFTVESVTTNTNSNTNENRNINESAEKEEFIEYNKKGVDG